MQELAEAFRICHQRPSWLSVREFIGIWVFSAGSWWERGCPKISAIAVRLCGNDSDRSWLGQS